MSSMRKTVNFHTKMRKHWKLLFDFVEGVYIAVRVRPMSFAHRLYVRQLLII